MNSFKEKVTFIITALAYVLFHLRLGPNIGSIAALTLEQMLLTAPYAIGFTYILAILIRKFTGRGYPPWDRLLRIFFTIGIFFAFFFALYEYGQRAEDQKQEVSQVASSHLIRDFSG